MTKLKVSINIRFTGELIFEYEAENNTIAKTVEQAIEDKKDLSSADLRCADLSSIKNDLWGVLLMAIPEIKNLKKSVIEGKIDGSTYAGECACLCGTLEKTQDVKIKTMIYDRRDSNRPIERFFLGIKKGDIPETNQISKIVLEWIEEFETFIPSV